MRISHKNLAKLKYLLKEQYGLDYCEDEVQQAGMAIIRFVLAKRIRQNKLTKNNSGKR